MVYRFKKSSGLNTDQVRELNHAWHHASSIGRPLNKFLSLRPLDIDGLDPADRCHLFARFRNKLGVFARSKGFIPTYIWSREINTDGTGEHMHVLIHVPRRYHERFDATVIGWYPGPGEIDITPANHHVRVHNGKRLSAMGYICKQMTPQAWYKRGLARKAGGTLNGKRGGVSTTLDWRAQAAWRERRNTIASVSRPGIVTAEIRRSAA